MIVPQNVFVMVDRLGPVMEPELNCSSVCDSPLCLIQAGLSRQEGQDILRRLCVLNSVIFLLTYIFYCRADLNLFTQHMYAHNLSCLPGAETVGDNQSVFETDFYLKLWTFPMVVEEMDAAVPSL